MQTCGDIHEGPDGSPADEDSCCNRCGQPDGNPASDGKVVRGPFTVFQKHAYCEHCFPIVVDVEIARREVASKQQKSIAEIVELIRRRREELQGHAMDGELPMVKAELEQAKVRLLAAAVLVEENPDVIRTPVLTGMASSIRNWLKAHP